jgi:O-antigen/teichoic acid export membrane protein
MVLMREVARDHRRLDSYYSDVLFSRVMLSVPPLLLALTIASATGMSGQTRLVALLMGFGFIADALLQVSFATFQAFERVNLTLVVLIAQRWITTSVAAAALFLGYGIITVAAIYCLGALLAALLAARLLYRRVARPRLRFSASGMLKVTREAVPIGLGIISFTLLSRVDMFMLGFYKPPAEVGQYGAAYRLLDTTAFVTWSVNTAVMPTLARLSLTTTPTIGEVYQRALKLVLSITLPLAVGAAVLAYPIITLLYGSQFHKAGGALLLLVPTIFLFPISSLTSQLFYVRGVRGVVATTYAALFVENVVLNLILIPRYSFYGAALGTSLSELLVAATLLYRVRSFRGRLDLRRMLTGACVGSAVAAGVMVLFHSQLALAIPIAVLAYAVVFLAFERVAYPQDFAVGRIFLNRLRAGAIRPAPSVGAP